MKRITTISMLLLVFNVCYVYSQSKIGLFFNHNVSTFRFLDSQNVITDLDFTYKYGYGLLFQRSLTKNIYLEGSLSYNIKGATSVMDLEKLDWSFHYLNTSLGAGYKFNIGNISPLGGVGLYYGRLLTADQFVGSEYYDLMSDGEFNKNDLGAVLFAGVEYIFSDAGSIFLKLNESIGLMNLENKESANQKMFNRTFAIQMGLIFSIK